MADAMKKPTNAERLLLYRRRMDMTQDEAADWLACGRTTYSRMENGNLPVTRAPAPRRARVPFAVDLQPGPTRQERLFLARRHSGLTLARIAADLGTSRVTVLKMERTGDPVLFRYWKNK